MCPTGSRNRRFFNDNVDISGVLGRAILICLTPWRNPCDLGKIMMVNLAILMKVSYFLLADFGCIVLFFWPKKRFLAVVDCGNFTGVFFHVLNFKTHRLPFFLGRKSQIFSRRRGTTQRRESEERNQEIGDCNTRQFLGEPTDSGWWFQIFHIFTPTWGRFPFWLIFFKWVETTN